MDVVGTLPQNFLPVLEMRHDNGGSSLPLPHDDPRQRRRKCDRSPVDRRWRCG